MLKDNDSRRRHCDLSPRRCGRSPTSRSSWCRTSPPRPSSPSRTPACSTSCASARDPDAAAADRHLRSAQGHLQLARRTGAGVQTMLANATRICEAKFGDSVSPKEMHFAVSRCTVHRPRYAEVAARRVPLDPATPILGRVRHDTKQAVQIADIRDEPLISRRIRQSAQLSPSSLVPHHARRADAQGERADRRDLHLPPGGPAVHRQADRAGQELRRPGRHRHREHPPAQRTARIAAAADRAPPRCCKVISPARPASWSRCFRPMLENAARICEAKFGMLLRTSTATLFRHGCHPRAPRANCGLRCSADPIRTAGAAASLNRMTQTRSKVVHISMTQARSESTRRPSSAELAGVTDHARRPDAQGGRADRRYHHLSPGGPAVHRQADRAGHELRRPGRHRHREHAAAQELQASMPTESLQQQTATSEVLSVISSSPGELEPVFQAMLENATTHLRGKVRHAAVATTGGMLYRGSCSHMAPLRAVSIEKRRRAPLSAAIRRHPRLGRARTDEAVHVADYG